MALQGLNRLGILTIDEEGGVSRGDSNDLVEARLRCSSKVCFAIRDDGGDDIYIRDHQLNHAWNGDRVLVRLTREGVDAVLPKVVFSAFSNAPQQASWPQWNNRMIV